MEQHKITKARNYAYEYKVTATCTCGWYEDRSKGTYQTKTVKRTNEELNWLIIEHKEDMAEKAGA